MYNRRAQAIVIASVRMLVPVRAFALYRASGREYTQRETSDGAV
jgi:hypothetical protein